MTRILLIVAALALTCCPDKPQTHAGKGSGPTAQSKTKPLPTLVVDARPHTARLRAGEQLQVECVALRDGRQLSEGEANTQLRMLPTTEPRMPRVDGAVTGEAPGATARATFVPERAGNYTIACTAAPLAKVQVRQAPSRSVQVVGTEERMLQVVLASESPMVRAGEAVDVRCVASDRFGNAMRRLSSTYLYVLSTDAAGTAGLTLRDGRLVGEKAGTYRLGCRAPGLIEAPAAHVEVVPGPAQRLHVEVEEAQQAGTAFPVRCIAEDAFGNRAPASDAVQLAADTPPESPAPQIQDGMLTLFAARPTALRCVDAHVASAASPTATVQVAPGLPARWSDNSGWALEDRCWAENIPHNVTAFVYDSYDNLLDRAPLDITAVAEDDAAKRVPPRIVGRGVIFGGSGTYTLEARVRPPHAPGASLEPRVRQHVYVNSTPPSIKLSAPLRAAHLQVPADEAQDAVPVVGSIDDPAGLRSVTLLGQAPQLLDGAPKHFAINAEHAGAPWGTSVVEIRATNVCGIESRVVQSYVRSPQFEDPRRDAPQPRRHAATLLIGAPMLQRVGSADLDNVAGVIEKALGTSLIPQSMDEVLAVYPEGPDGKIDLSKKWGLGYQVNRTADLVYQRPTVERLEIADGKLHLRVTLHDVKIGTSVAVFVGPGFLSRLWRNASRHEFKALISAQEVTLNAALSVDAEGIPKVLKEDVDVEFVEGPNIALGSESDRKHFLALLPQATFDLFTMFSTRHGEALKRAIAAHMHAAAEQGLIEALHALSWPVPLRLPEPFQGNVSLKRDGERLRFVKGADEAATPTDAPPTADHVEVAIDGHISPGEQNAASEALPDDGMRALFHPEHGAIRHAEALPPIALTAADSFGVLVHDDLVNEFLWAMWASGAFNIADARQLLPQTPANKDLTGGSRIALYALTPPIVMPSAAPNRLILAWGDVLVDAEVNTSAAMRGMPATRVPVRMFASAKLEAGLSLDSTIQRLRVHFDEQNLSPLELKTQMVHLPGNANMMAASHDMIEAYLSQVLPGLIKRALEDLPLPAVNISSITGMPEQTAWRLRDATLTRPAKGAYTQLLGGVDSVVAPQVATPRAGQ